MSIVKKQFSLDKLIQRSKKAQLKYSSYDQREVDRIFKKCALEANKQRLPLAQLAVSETGMGVIEDKVIKNHFASEFIYNKYKNLKTCGVIEEHRSDGLFKIAEPVGLIAGVVPTTNPTSTAIFKSLLTLKTRNSLIISPHPRAIKSTVKASRTIYEAALEAGAPEDIIQWIEEPTVELTKDLMQHPDVNLILATGGPQMVRSSYSSGHPSIGVGAGNTPVLVDKTADIKMTVSSILLSKTFDNGMICASEQSVIIEEPIYNDMMEEFQKRGAYVVPDKDIDTVRKATLKDGKLNAELVGKTAQEIAKIVGIEVPYGTKCLLCQISEVGKTEPLSYEKLFPVLSVYKVPFFDQGLQIAHSLSDFGGRGHTSVLYTQSDNMSNILKFENTMKTVRILINSPASQGAIGDVYNFSLDPSLTLGCGTWGATSVSANVSPTHLLNTKTVTHRRENMLWFRVPSKIYFKENSINVGLKELKGKKKAFIVTDKPLYEMGMLRNVTKILDELEINHDTFYDVSPDPTVQVVENGLKQLRMFQPDVIIAVGGGSPMDAAKIMWLLYEQPDTEFESLATRFMDIRKRVYELPPLGQKAEMVCIPTTSGTGSEVTPFSVITDEKTGQKYPLADYALTPTMAIIDPIFVKRMPKSLTAYGGIDALTHALESYVSICATEYTRGLSKQAIHILDKYLARAYKNGASDLEAREKVHYGATVAGMAFANAFLGICHSIAHKLGAHYHIPHGLANALMINHVIQYNATDAPEKQATFPQYKYPRTLYDYGNIAKSLGIQGKTDMESVNNLISRIEEIKIELNIPLSLGEVLGEDKYEKFVKDIPLIAEEAFDDQCTGSNPRYPLIKDIEKMLLRAWKPIVLCQE